MGTKNTERSKYGIANFAALETAIANGEERLVKELLGDQTMPDIEKSYLIDFAKLSNNPAIIKLLEDIPLKE